MNVEIILNIRLYITIVKPTKRTVDKLTNKLTNSKYKLNCIIDTKITLVPFLTGNYNVSSSRHYGKCLRHDWCL